MNNFKLSGIQKIANVLIGFAILFSVYHFPEVLQNHYQKPLILLFESCMLLFTFLAFIIGKQKFKNGFRMYGLWGFRQHLGNLAKGLIIGIFISVFANLIPVWFGWNEMFVHFDLNQILLQTLLFAVGTLLPSLAEDLLTRGYLKAFWPEKWNRNGLILLSAVVYVLNHIFRINKPDVMLYLFILGLFLMWAFIATGSLWLTLGIHWGSNIAYQFFTNVVTTNSLKETGMENYILAGCYALGFGLVVVLYKKHFFNS
ncbi:MAG: CPBP family intramembrane metalloprotease [Prolixibacteraceae bacterium]|nr:CPBP family intramembrane metalloprotease [Prolixibacteraceae bacterium]